MARREVTGALDDMLAGRGPVPDAGPERGDLKVYHVRLLEGHWKRLQEHFADQGVPTSTGIRQVLARYIKENAL